MIKMAIITGVFVASGYLFVMISAFDVAMNQTQQLSQQYQQAITLADQMAANNSAAQQ